MRRGLKAERWWDIKIPPLLTVAYFLLAHASPPVPLETALGLLALFVLASIGIAGFGHFLNDLFDVQVDAVSMTHNLAQGTRSRHLIFSSALLLVGLAPWFWLPIDARVWALLGCEFLLFAAYSIPPVRLKARGIAGVFADACYAYVIPLLVMWLTFAAVCGLETPLWFGALLGVWGFAFGMRQILHHELNDRVSDAQVHIRTFAVQYGQDATLAFIRMVVLPIEVFAFLALLGVYSTGAPWVALALPVYLLWEYLKMQSLWLQPLASPWRAATGSVVNVWALLILNRFYERWLPVLLLVALVAAAPAYLVLAGLHLVLFQNCIRDFLQEVKRLRARRAAAVSAS